MKESEPIVGVRELRTHLSAYLRKVSRGATVTIGNRGRRPVARLIPIDDVPDEEPLNRLVVRGVARRGSGKPGVGQRVKPRKAHPSVAELVVEDRR